MLIVRKAQMQVFTEKEIKNFEDRMIEHLREFFPDRFEKEGEPAMRDLIRYGVDQAEGYGITGERDVCKYIDLMAAFDRDFDLAEWAEPILNSDAESPTNKVNHLCEKANFIIENKGQDHDAPK